VRYDSELKVVPVAQHTATAMAGIIRKDCFLPESIIAPELADFIERLWSA
jgi:hypothetical protein